MGAPRRRGGTKRKRSGGRSYARALKRPEWKAKRARIVERAGNRCEWCGRSGEILQVHHGYYGKDENGVKRPPEEHPDDTLWALCDYHHLQAEAARAGLYYQLAKIHPKHHWRIRQLLLDVQELIASEQEELLEQRSVVIEG